MLVSAESFVALQGCHFQNLDLTSELVDVSFGGAVNMQACTFTNCAIPRNHIVSTSFNDYTPCSAWSPGMAGFLYFPQDDEEYDFEWELIDPDNAVTGASYSMHGVHA